MILSSVTLNIYHFRSFINVLSVLDVFTFPSNSLVGATQCLTITVTDDKVYGASLVLTVTLSKMVDQGRLVLGNTVTMVTINDDDGETVIYS